MRETLEKVKFIQEKLVASQSRKKGYTNHNIRDIEFMIGDQALPLDILYRVRKISYSLTFSLFFIELHLVLHRTMLKRYHIDENYIIHWDSVLFVEYVL